MILLIYLTFSIIIFVTGIIGIILNINNIKIFPAYIGLTLLAISTNFIAYARLWNDLNGLIFVLFILTIMLIKLSIGFTILLKFLKLEKNST